MFIADNSELRAFERIAELKSAHAAAKELRLTQAAVTKRIQSLERKLGVSLFLRSRRGMSLTDEGQSLLQLCKSGRELEGEFFAQIQKGLKAREVSLRVLGPTSALSTRVTDQVLPIYCRFPYLRVHLESDDHSDLVQRLKRGEGDLAVVSPEQVPNEMDSKVLRPDRYLLVASQAWAKRSLEEILANERAIDFHERDLTTDRYLRAFGLQRALKKARIFANENESLIRLFQAGVGFGTLTESVARSYLERGTLVALNRGRAMEDPLALAWFPRSHMPEYLSALVRQIK